MSNRGKLHTPTTSLLMAAHTPSMLLPQSSASLLMSISFHLWRNPPCHLPLLLSQVSFKFGSMFEICVWTAITSSSPSWLKPQHLSPGLVQEPPHCSPCFCPCPPTDYSPQNRERDSLAMCRELNDHLKKIHVYVQTLRMFPFFGKRVFGDEIKLSSLCRLK